MDLDEVRARIRAIDADIVRLIGERVAAAAKAGAVKREAGLPIRDYETERAVVETMRQGVRESGVDPDLGERVARLLIEASLRRQETEGTPVAKGRVGHAVVVGGAGKMGRWFADYLNARGYEVIVVDPAGPLDGYAYAADLGRAVKEADVVVLSVPPDATAQVLEVFEKGDGVGFEGLLVDVASIKGPFVRTLQRLANRMRVASIHPLWGPDTRVLSGKNLLVLDCGHRAAADEIAALFSGTAARIHRLPLDEHDAVMAYTLGLPHALSLVFAEVLLASRRDFADLRRLGGPTFLKQSAVAAEVAAENREMYRQIQTTNPHTPEVYDELRAAVDALAKRLETSEDFAARMGEYDTYFKRFKEWWP